MQRIRLLKYSGHHIESYQYLCLKCTSYHLIYLLVSLFSFYMSLILSKAKAGSAPLGPLVVGKQPRKRCRQRLSCELGIHHQVRAASPRVPCGNVCWPISHDTGCPLGRWNQSNQRKREELGDDMDLYGFIVCLGAWSIICFLWTTHETNTN